MKLNQTINTNNPFFSRVFHWIKLVTVTGLSQSIIQVLGLMSGILIIRYLSKQEYALYTLANTMLGTMMILTDSGISTGVMAQGSKVWHDKVKLGVVLVTGLDLRKKFAIGVLLVVTPILLYLLIYHGATWFMAILLVISLIPSFLASLSGTLLSIAPKLHQDIVMLQKNQVTSNSARLVMTILALLTFPFAFLTILVSGLPQIWANRNILKVSAGYTDWKQDADKDVRKEILKIVKRTYPATIYFCIYSQINIWICSVIGSTDAVAQIGALSRLVMVLTLFSVIFNTLITPRFSKLTENKFMLRKRLFQILFLLMLLNLMIIGVVWLFPSEVLWVLGKDYSNLTTEIVLNVIGSCLIFIAGSIVSLYSCRGWVMNPFIQILTSITAVATGSMIFDLSSLQGVFIFNIYLAVIQVVMFFSYILLKINKVQSH